MARYDLEKMDIAEIDIEGKDVVANIITGLEVLVDSDRMGDGAYGAGTYQVKVLKSKSSKYPVGESFIWDAGLEGKEAFDIP